MNAVLATICPAAKAWATFQARAALAGHTCTRDASGWVTLSRWCRSITFEDMGAASAWLDRIVLGAQP